MAAALAQPGEVLDIAVSTKRLASSETSTLVKTGNLQVVRLVIAAGKQMDTHKAPGEITLVCVQGRISFFVEGKPREVVAGQFLYLPPGVPHAVRGEEDSIVLLTIVTAKESRERPQYDPVEEAGEESFPASDPPSYTPVTRP